jgi:hypothetical protein
VPGARDAALGAEQLTRVARRHAGLAQVQAVGFEQQRQIEAVRDPELLPRSAGGR